MSCFRSHWINVEIDYLIKENMESRSLRICIRRLLLWEGQRKFTNYFITNNGNILSDNFEIAYGFNDIFASIGNELAGQIPSSKKNFTEYLSEETEEGFVFANLTGTIILDETKVKNSAGPDKLLKETFECFLKPLVHVFKLSFKTGYIPPELETAKIIPGVEINIASITIGQSHYCHLLVEIV